MSKEVTSMILKYFKESFRPFSSNDIVEKFGKEHGKSLILKSIDKLVSNEAITEKIFGKNKIYYFKDDKTDKKSNSAEISGLESKLQKLNSELKLKQEESQRLGDELREIVNLPSIAELEEERERLNYKVEANIERLDRIKYLQSSQPTALKPEQIIKIESCHEKIVTTYRKRKRICADMIDAIMEGYPKTKKRLIEELEIETDESVGFQIET